MMLCNVETRRRDAGCLYGRNKMFFVARAWVGSMLLRVSPAPDADHTVRFYDSDAHLLDQLTSFVREGLTRNERVVAMATTKNLDALRQIIAAQTLPADALQTIDAVEALDAIVVNDRLDEAEVARWFDAR